MWAKILIPLLAVPVGLFTALNIDNYAQSLRGCNVMAMAEVPDDLVSVPQPKPYIEPAKPVYTTRGCNTRVVRYTSCAGTYYNVSYRPYRHCTNWWDRGPVRRTVKWFHYRRPVRRFLARIFCGRRWC